MSRLGWLGLSLIVGALIVVTIILAADASAHFKPGRHNVLHAINQAWCGKARRSCASGNEAAAVSWCESRWRPWARNGQYRGTFQMGEEERKRYGHGIDPWTQARAAHRYWKLAGWNPWRDCR